MKEIITVISIKRELITLSAFILIGLFLDLNGIIEYEKEFLELFPSWQFDLIIGILFYNIWTIIRLVLIPIKINFQSKVNTNS